MKGRKKERKKEIFTNELRQSKNKKNIENET